MAQNARLTPEDQWAEWVTCQEDLGEAVGDMICPPGEDDDDHQD